MPNILMVRVQWENTDRYSSAGRALVRLARGPGVYQSFPMYHTQIGYEPFLRLEVQ